MLSITMTDLKLNFYVDSVRSPKKLHLAALKLTPRIAESDKPGKNYEARSHCYSQVQRQTVQKINWIPVVNLLLTIHSPFLRFGGKGKRDVLQVGEGIGCIIRLILSVANERYLCSTKGRTLFQMDYNGVLRHHLH